MLCNAVLPDIFAWGLDGEGNISHSVGILVDGFDLVYVAADAFEVDQPPDKYEYVANWSPK